jgi:NAD(P)-dependent dehydrogenase (short-subunit alcohol dehydrogenase family)
VILITLTNFHFSVIADLQPIDFDNFFLFDDDKYNGLQAYKNSKAAMIMFTYELARRLENTGVKVNAVCPGAYLN